MSGVDRVLFSIQAAMALTACLVGVYAAGRIPSPSLAKMFGAIGALAGVYATVLTGIVVEVIPQAGGVTFIRGMSLIAWPLAWIAPPLVTLAAGPKFARRLVATIADNLSHG